MRHLAIMLLAALVLILLFEVHSQSATIKTLQQQAAVPAVPSLELQEKCAKQAAVEYKQEGLEDKSIAEFTNHYSMKFGRCFVVTKDTSVTANIPSTRKLLVDAYEGRVIGTYEWMNSQGKKFWEVEPMECSVDQPAGDPKKCKSDTEWDELVESYMRAP